MKPGREHFRSQSTDPDLLVSWNLRKARNLRGWTQAEASQHLGRFGLSWSVASLSDAERAWTPEGRQREFTATDLVAFSLAYDLPLAWWLLPPPPSERAGMTIRMDGLDEPLDNETLTSLCLGSSPEIEDRMSSLGISRSLAAEDKRHFLALLNAQEAQLAGWMKVVRDTRSTLEQQSEHPTEG